MTYQEALRYFDSFINYEKQASYNYRESLKLDRIRNLARAIGDPQKGIKSIHIAGTKGKGSTAAMVHSILKKAGFRTGLYTSPHLLSFRERIKVDDEFISEEDIPRLLEIIDERTCGFKLVERPSFFEIYTALAFLYFKEMAVDFAVYETGLGGRLDATNVVDSSITAITPISYEHTDKLGNTLGEIAREKAGIIKDGSICIVAPQEQSALDAIEDACVRRQARMVLVGRDVTFKEVSMDETSSCFDVHGLWGKYNRLESHLIGAYQITNAAAAVGIVEALNFYGIKIKEDAVRSGLVEARWPGRLEVAGRRPYLVLDGAQNRASAKALAESVRKIFSYRKLVLILGVSKDKDVNGIMEELLPIADSVILTKSKIVERAMEPAEIREFIKGREIETDITSNVADAIALGREKASVGDLILATGSLFVVGEAKKVINHKNTV